jgi:hypothetical protein
VLAAQLGLPLHNIDSTDVPLYLVDGSQPDKQLDEEVGAGASAGTINEGCLVCCGDMQAATPCCAMQLPAYQFVGWHCLRAAPNPPAEHMLTSSAKLCQPQLLVLVFGQTGSRIQGSCSLL